MKWSSNHNLVSFVYSGDYTIQFFEDLNKLFGSVNQPIEWNVTTALKAAPLKTWVALNLDATYPWNTLIPNEVETRFSCRFDCHCIQHILSHLFLSPWWTAQDLYSIQRCLEHVPPQKTSLATLASIAALECAGWTFPCLFISGSWMKGPFGWNHLASLYFSRRLFQTTKPNKQGNMLSFRATWSHLYPRRSFSLNTPCPKCPTPHWVFYLKRYRYHCSHSFHDSCCQCSAWLTWAHVDHAKFKLQKLNFWSETHWSGHGLCMYEANWASQALTRRASHAINRNKACCQVFQTRLPSASYVLFVAASLRKN